MTTHPQSKAVVLAAGAGTRLDPLTRRLPKPLVPVANCAVMEHTLRLLKKHNIDNVAANLHYLADSVSDYFSKHTDHGVSINFVKEEKLSGDAGGVRACRKFLWNDTFLVIMGDLITDMDLTALIEQHKKSKAIVSIALKKVEDVQHFGVVALDDAGYVKAFQEKPQPAEAISNLASTGIYVCEPEIFDFIPEDGEFGFGRQLFPKLLEAGKLIQGVETNAYWNDIGTIATYRQATFDVLDGKVDLSLPGEIIKEDAIEKNNLLVDGTLQIGHGVILGAGVKIKGHVVLGDNCMIGSGVVLEDSIIWANSTVAANSCIKRTVIAESCHLRSFSRWADAVIGEVPSSPEGKLRILGRAKSKKAFAS